MSDLESICREAARGIAGAKAYPGGGLTLARRGFAARVEFARGEMDILFDTRDLAVESIRLRKAGLWHDLKDLFGKKDVQIGDPEFDERFDLQTSHLEFARKVLQPEVRAVLRMAVLFGDFTWRLSRAGFQMRVHHVPADREDLDRWLMTAFQLLDALPGADGKDRVTLGAVRIRTDGEATCPICGATLAEGSTVRCARCSTPHHRECWEFNGRCSTFACGETRSR